MKPRLPATHRGNCGYAKRAGAKTEKCRMVKHNRFVRGNPIRIGSIRGGSLS